VAVLVDPAGRGTTLTKGSQVLVPYGHGFHEDAGLELARRLARSSGATIHLLGGGDDASHDLAEVAADAYGREGVWTTSDTVTGDVVGAVLQASRKSDLVVLAVSETWADDDKGSLGRLRDVVAGASTTPLLIVRRHGQASHRGPRRWFSRRGEWMEDASGELDLRDRVTEGEASVVRCTSVVRPRRLWPRTVLVA
jgi:hypothetical protein